MEFLQKYNSACLILWYAIVGHQKIRNIPAAAHASVPSISILIFLSVYPQCKSYVCTRQIKTLPPSLRGLVLHWENMSRHSPGVVQLTNTSSQQSTNKLERSDFDNLEVFVHDCWTWNIEYLYFCKGETLQFWQFAEKNWNLVLLWSFKTMFNPILSHIFGTSYDWLGKINM